MEIISSPITTPSFKKLLEHGSNDSELDDTTGRVNNNSKSEKNIGYDSSIVKNEEIESKSIDISDVEIEVEEEVAFEKLSLLVPFDYLPSVQPNAAEVSVLTAETRNSQSHQKKVKFVQMSGNIDEICFILLHYAILFVKGSF